MLKVSLGFRLEAWFKRTGGKQLASNFRRNTTTCSSNDKTIRIYLFNDIQRF